MKRRLVIVCIGVIILAGISTKNISLQIGNWGEDTISQQLRTGKIAFDSLQNITWNILIFPWAYDLFIQKLSQPTQRLQIQTYDFTEKRIKDLLKTFLNKGTDIQLIMENKKYQQFIDTFADIQKTFASYPNFQIQSDEKMGTEYVHSKIDLLDEAFFIKTANLTHSSLFSNREYMFYSQDTWVLQSLKTIFTKDRAGEHIENGDIHPNLVICNINCRAVIEKLLSSAKQSIIIQTQYINDPTLIDILISKKLTLSEIKILVANTTESTDMLAYMGAQARKEKKEYLHAKMILIDHKILLLGSMNLSANSLDKNREIWILLTDSSLIRQFASQFTKDWNLAKNSWLLKDEE